VIVGNRDFFPDVILGTTLGEENTFGALEGRTLSGPVTLGRASTDDLTGKINVGEGRLPTIRWIPSERAPWLGCPRYPR
jgi:L-fucose isomerase-like protein